MPIGRWPVNNGVISPGDGRPQAAKLAIRGPVVSAKGDRAGLASRRPSSIPLHLRRCSRARGTAVLELLGPFDRHPSSRLAAGRDVS